MYNGFRVFEITNTKTGIKKYHFEKDNVCVAELTNSCGTAKLVPVKNNKPSSIDTISVFDTTQLTTEEIIIKATGILEDKSNLAKKTAKQMIHKKLLGILDLIRSIEGQDISGFQIEFCENEKGIYHTSVDLIKKASPDVPESSLVNEKPKADK